MRTRVLLLHGAWHDAHAWESVVDSLRDSGDNLDIEAINLPGLGRAQGGHTLRDHSAYLRTIIGSSDQPTLLVAHSYGGAVATEALDQIVSVNRILFVTAFALPAGLSCMGMNDSAEGSESDSDAFVVDGDYVLMPPDAAIAAFYNDLPRAQALQWAGRLKPEHHDTVYARTHQTAWRTIPHGYVICTEDSGILPSVQRQMAESSDRLYELAAGHSPMLSRPIELADIILREASALTG